MRPLSPKGPGLRLRVAVLSLLAGAALAACGEADESQTYRGARQALTDTDVGQALRAGDSTTASFGTSDPAGYRVLTTAAAQFPTEGNSYLVISSGCTSLTFPPTDSGGANCVLGGLQSPNGQDMVQAIVDSSIPPGAQCWLVDWKFLSEESTGLSTYPFNDAFLMEVGSSDINIAGTAVSSPNNVAYDASGKGISVNMAGSIRMTASKAQGTSYNRATDRLTTRAPIPQGASTLRLIFTVMDQGDSSVDSAAFIDNIRFDGGPCSAPETQPAPQNSPPSLTVQAPSVTVDEGAMASLSGTYSDANVGDVVTLTASVGSITQTAGGAWTWSFDAQDGPVQNQLITVTANDGKGGTATRSFSLNILNAAPQAFIDAPGSGSEGVVIHLSGSSTDPSPVDTAAGTTLSWAVTKDGIPYTAGTGASLSVVPEDSGTYEAVLTAQDKDGATGSKSTTIVISNTAPTAVLTSSASSLNEGASVTVGFSDAFDPSAADTAAGLRYAFACEGVLGPVAYETSGTNASTVCTFADNGTYTIHARVMDKDDGFTDATATVVVNNVAPAITRVSTPSAALRVGTAAQVNAVFTDPGMQDTHVCTFFWDDGTTDTVVASARGGSGACTAARTYTGAGVYSVVVSVMDKDGGAAVASSELVVVYDPDGGSVTGGGWILSPAGASVAEPSATGRANFSFVSRYQEGADVPTGQTEFLFTAGDVNFHSEAYEWLVVAGARAQYKGTGRINNAGEYGFLLTAVDGQVNGGHGADLLRLKIWNKETGATVYDNRLGQSDDPDAMQPQALGGGSIVIHQ